MPPTVPFRCLLWFLGVRGLFAYLGSRYWVRPAAYLDRVGGRAIEPLPTFDDEEGGGPTGVGDAIRRAGPALPLPPGGGGPPSQAAYRRRLSLRLRRHDHARHPDGRRLRSRTGR